MFQRYGPARYSPFTESEFAALQALPTRYEAQSHVFTDRRESSRLPPAVQTLHDLAPSAKSAGAGPLWPRGGRNFAMAGLKRRRKYVSWMTAGVTDGPESPGDLQGIHQVASWLLVCHC